MAYYHEPSDKPVYRPTFYRPVENSEKVYEVLANGISDELPDIISIIDPENMQAVVKSKYDCPAFKKPTIGTIIPGPKSLKSVKQELQLPVTGLHTLGITATKQLVCLTFTDPKEVLSREQQTITRRMQDYIRRTSYKYWSHVVSSNTEPHIPIAIAGGGLPESSLDEYAAERLAGKDLFVVLGRLAVSPDVRAKSSKKSHRSPKAIITPKNTDSISARQTPSGITVVHRLPSNREGIPAGLLQTIRHK